MKNSKKKDKAYQVIIFIEEGRGKVNFSYDNKFMSVDDIEFSKAEYHWLGGPSKPIYVFEFGCLNDILAERLGNYILDTFLKNPKKYKNDPVVFSDIVFEAFQQDTWQFHPHNKKIFSHLPISQALSTL